MGHLYRQIGCMKYDAPNFIRTWSVNNFMKYEVINYTRSTYHFHFKDDFNTDYKKTVNLKTLQWLSKVTRDFDFTLFALLYSPLLKMLLWIQNNNMNIKHTIYKHYQIIAESCVTWNRSLERRFGAFHIIWMHIKINS